MSMKYDEHGNKLSELRQRCKPLNDETYYYQKDNTIWFCDDGDRIFIANVENINRRPDFVNDIVTSLNETLR